jgi:hypothetical protein
VRLRELFEAVIAARTHLGLAQSVTGAVKQALTAFMIAMRNVEISGPSPTGNRHRRVARAALEGCYDGIPCWIMPNWRVAEQLPAKLGGFDLAIIDGASRCDVRELTILLRGRKVLVIGDEKPSGPVAIGIANDKIDWLEHNCLRTVPKTIRPFLLPGSSLCDLAKVAFPDAFIMGVAKETIPSASTPMINKKPINGFAIDEDALLHQVMAPPTRTEDALRPRVRAEATALMPLREVKDLDAKVDAIGSDYRGDAMPRIVQPLIPGPSEPRDQLLPARPAIQDGPLHVSAASAVNITDLPWHALAARRGLAVAAGFAIAFVFVGTVYVLLGVNRNSQAGSQASPELPSVASLQATASAPAPTSSQFRMADRVEQSPSQGPQGDLTDNAAAGDVVTQKAVLFEEDPGDAHGGARLNGSARWHSESGAPGGATGVLVKADIEIPDRRLTMAMSLRRNTDHAMPASHVVEFKFMMPSDSPYGGVAKMLGIQMKQQLEQIRGAVLAGMVAKVTSGYFLVGLSSTDFELRRNLSMLKERSWIEVPIVYGNGTRAILDIEKGSPGERALSDAFVAWGE